MKKLFLLFATLLVTTLSLRAETETFDFTQNDYGLPNNNSTYVTNPTTINEGAVNIVLNGNTNAWRYWSDGLRVYYKSNPYFTVSGKNGEKITGVKINAASSVKFALSSNATAKDAISEWTGSESSITFYGHIGTDSKAVTSIEVTYEEGEGGSQGGGTTDPVDPDPTDPVEPDPTEPDTPSGNTTIDDEITLSMTGVTATSYANGNFSGKSGASGAVYAGQIIKNGDNIQFRATTPGGIVTTTSGGKAKKIKVTWASSNNTNGRILNIYGSNTAYSSGEDLYKSGLAIIGTIVYGTSTELTIDEDYEYIGIRPSNGAAYVESITITWEQGNDEGGDDDRETLKFAYSAESAEYDLNSSVEKAELPSLVIEPAYAEITVSYTSSDNKVATVETDGTVTPLAVGETTITATFAGDKTYTTATAQYTLTVIDTTPGEDPVPGEEDKTKWILVTSTKDLKAGDQVVVVYEDATQSYAASNVEQAYYRERTAVTVTDGEVKTVSITDDVLILEVGYDATQSYPYTFMTTNYAGKDGYIGNTTSGKNYCSIGDIANGRRATVSFSDENANITFNFQSSNKYYSLKYNANKDQERFACYTSEQKDIKLFKKVTAPEVPDFDDIRIGVYDSTNGVVFTDEKCEGTINLEAEGDGDVSANVFVKIIGKEEHHVIYYYFEKDEANGASQLKGVAKVPAKETFTEIPENGVELYNTGSLHFYAKDPNTNLTSDINTITVTGTGSGTSEIVNIVVDSANAPVEFFNLQGVRVDNPANGIFIRRQGNTVSKVVIR